MLLKFQKRFQSKNSLRDISAKKGGGDNEQLLKWLKKCTHGNIDASYFIEFIESFVELISLYNFNLYSNFRDKFKSSLYNMDSSIPLQVHHQLAFNFFFQVKLMFFIRLLLVLCSLLLPVACKHLKKTFYVCVFCPRIFRCILIRILNYRFLF